MAIYLIPVDGGARVPINKAVLFVGRHPDCDLVLKTSRKVSRKHCCIAQVNENFFIRDLGSMNGVRLNGSPIDGQAQLRLGDELIIGDIRYKLLSEKKSPTPQAEQIDDIEPLDISELPIQGMNAEARRPLNSPGPEDISLDYPVALPEADDSQVFVIEEAGDSSSDDLLVTDSNSDL